MLGGFNVWSDIDVLLIGDFRGNPLERLLGLPLNFEVIPLTEEEFHKALVKNNPITWDVRSNGVVLRDDLGLCEKYNISCFRDLTSSPPGGRGFPSLVRDHI